MPSNDRDKGPSYADLLKAWDAFYDVDMNNVPELANVMEQNYEALFHDGTATYVKNRLKSWREMPFGIEEIIKDTQEHLDLLEEAKVYGISAALTRLRMRRFK